MSQANKRLTSDPDYLASVNEDLAEEGLEYKGTVEPKHLMWAIIEDIGIDTLKAAVTRPLTGFKIAPFYGCYIVRPSSALDFDDNPERKDSLEHIIEAVGAEVVDFDGKTACCGFPILTINQTASLTMVANHTGDAKHKGAMAMVTPCPCATSTSTGTSRRPPRSASRSPLTCRSSTSPRCSASPWASTPRPCASTSTSSPRRSCCPRWR